MPIIDAQVHCYERDHPGRPWHAVLHGPPEVTGPDMIKAMDEVGVDGAILVSAFTMYRFDASYAVDVRNAYPDRFGLVKPIDTTDPANAETVAEWKRVPGAVGVRLFMRDPVTRDPADPGINRMLAAAAKHGLPVNTLAYGRLDQVDELARRNPDTVMVLDHLGLQQPYVPPAPDEPWADLPNLLALAKHPNVVVKITGACTLSKTGYPYDDIWDPLARIIDAFGLERCLWGTDWTRAVGILSYRQGVEPFRITDRFTASERAALMGGNTARVYRWAPGKN